MQCDFELKHMDEVHMVYCRHYGAYTQMQRAFEKLMTILKLHLLIN